MQADQGMLANTTIENGRQDNTRSIWIDKSIFHYHQLPSNSKVKFNKNHHHVYHDPQYYDHHLLHQEWQWERKMQVTSRETKVYHKIIPWRKNTW